MERCSHRDDVQTFGSRKDLRVAQLVIQCDRVVCSDAAEQRIADSAWLLVNFFEHEVGIAFFFGHLGGPGNRLGRPAYALTAGTLDLNSVAADDGDLAVLKENHVSRVRQQGGNIGCDEVFA